MNPLLRRPAFAMLAGLLLLPTATSLAQTLRIGIVAGNNEGAPMRAPLKYAQSDARRIASALTSVGGFAPENVDLLLDADADALDAAFTRAEEKLAGAPGEESLLLVYFSGHSDGTVLELGKSRYPFSRLKERVEGSGAKVRLALVDACFSGGLVGTKGVSRGPSFDIDLHGDLNTEGTAILASAGFGELAQESARLGGSYFTHHLVSALYGAADDDSDLRVTLKEAYLYAYRHTVGDTAANVAGAQHPSYSLDLEGKGELVLAALSDKAAAVVFPAASQGTYYLTTGDRELVAELTQPGDRDRALFVPPGSFHLLRRQADGIFQECTVEVAAGGRFKVDPSAMKTAAGDISLPRGGEPSRNNIVAAGYGLTGWFLPAMGAMHGAELSYTRLLEHFAIGARLGWGRASVNEDGFVYDLDGWEAAVSALWRFPLYRVDLFAGVVGGASCFQQETDVLGTLTAWAALAGAQVGGAVHPFEALTLMMSFEMDVFVGYVNRRPGAWPAPRAFVGAGWSF